MSLRFFVEYNNAWWFAIISGVDVPSIGYDTETDTGSIVLDIRYGHDHLLAMQLSIWERPHHRAADLCVQQLLCKRQSIDPPGGNGVRYEYYVTNWNPTGS